MIDSGASRKLSLMLHLRKWSSSANTVFQEEYDMDGIFLEFLTESRFSGGRSTDKRYGTKRLRYSMKQP